MGGGGVMKGKRGNLLDNDLAFVVSYQNIHIRTGVKMLPNSRIVGFVS